MDFLVVARAALCYSQTDTSTRPMHSTFIYRTLLVRRLDLAVYPRRNDTPRGYIALYVSALDSNRDFQKENNFGDNR